MNLRSQLPMKLQRQLKVRQISGVEHTVNVTLGLSVASAMAVLGTLLFAAIPH
jgi:hypothetical protein